MTNKKRDQHSDGKGSISAAITEVLSYWTRNGYDRMDAIKWSDVESWDVALAACLVVSSNEHGDTAEDDDGLDELDGMETRAYIFDKRGFTTMDDIAAFKSMHVTATFTIMDEDAMTAATKNTMTQRHLLILCDPLVGIWKERKDRNLKAGRRDRIIPTSLYRDALVPSVILHSLLKLHCSY
ncbi:predicted protein [Lichtheimia corymbifera JMRC:FSU:9682]|uniref:Uncharacterized protein n=1 Tax=Lichtheimia corymbifera JMRC:FSU:9682 TaxID=1263082 RepID=A0A068SAQ4_9FUNG|nr:predicted protein [Lichtheimia corymbifera JMRC:FSU:9682]